MKKFTSMRQIIICLVMALMVTTVVTKRVSAKTENIKVTAPSGKTVKVAKGKKVTLKTVVKKLKDKKVTYKSSNPLVAKVNAKGVVKGVKAGTTKIVVASKSEPSKNTVVKVQVFKNAVKKIKLNKTAVSLNKGGKFTLKATVTPKSNVSKVLEYKSSNTKVAKVTKKGIIKAVGVGSAKITVKATDGSNKKAVCKVVVNEEGNKLSNVANAANIKNASIRSLYSFDIELVNAEKLEYTNVSAYYKYLQSSQYTAKYSVQYLNTRDNKKYEVVVDSALKYGTYIKFVIKTSKGVSTKEFVVDKVFSDRGVISGNTKDYYYVEEVGDSEDINITPENIYGNFIYAAPYQMSVSNLPEGLNARIAEGGTSVRITGRYSKRVFGHKAVVTCVDARGEKYFINLYFYVGDYDHVYAKADDRTYLAYKYSSDERDYYLMGQKTYNTEIKISDYYSGNLKDWKDFSATGLPENVGIDDEGNISVIDDKKSVKPGVYNVNISFTTKNDKNITVPYKLNLVDGVIISGSVKDAAGRVVTSEKINIKSSDILPSEVKTDTNIQLDENGCYKIRLLPGNYNVSIYKFYQSYRNNFSVSTNYDIVSEYYKVLFTSPLLTDNRDYITIVNNLYIVDKDELLTDVTHTSKMSGVNTEYMVHTLTLSAYLRKGTYKFRQTTNRDLVIGAYYYGIDTKEFEVKGQETIEINLIKGEKAPSYYN